MKVLLVGSTGKMGQVSQKALAHSPDITLAGTVNRNQDLATKIVTHQPDCVLDFAGSQGLWARLQIILDHRIRPVIGSSGLTEEHINTAKAHCQKIKLGGMIVPNFSLGACLMMKFAAECAAHFPDANIIEMHHPSKLDAPSSTAIKTAQMIAENRDTTQTHHSAEIYQNALGAVIDGVPVQAIRSQGVIANQIVQFGGPCETLKIEHHTLDRDAFIPGILVALRRVMKLQYLMHGLL